jgi:hypothetical protein
LPKPNTHKIALRPDQLTISGCTKVIERQHEAARQCKEPIERDLSAPTRKIEGGTVKHGPTGSTENESPRRDIFPSYLTPLNHEITAPTRPA